MLEEENAKTTGPRAESGSWLQCPARSLWGVGSQWTSSCPGQLGMLVQLRELTGLFRFLCRIETSLSLGAGTLKAGLVGVSTSP